MRKRSDARATFWAKGQDVWLLRSTHPVTGPSCVRTVTMHEPLGAADAAGTATAAATRARASSAMVRFTAFVSPVVACEPLREPGGSPERPGFHGIWSAPGGRSRERLPATAL